MLRRSKYVFLKVERIGLLWELSRNALYVTLLTLIVFWIMLKTTHPGVSVWEQSFCAEQRSGRLPLSMGDQKCKDLYTREQRTVWVARHTRISVSNSPRVSICTECNKKLIMSGWLTSYDLSWRTFDGGWGTRTTFPIWYNLADSYIGEWATCMYIYVR